ncbi:MAG: tetratricopeptide repeat protein [Candidatus Zixiibacteriota bacterium]|nr:MAG: tetratricopeptide repeat protein [candidate division Zixibacteria bacterium]
MPEEREQALFYVPLLIILLVFVAGNWGNVQQLWGLNFLKFFDPTLFFLALAVVVVAALPPVYSRISSALSALAGSGGAARLLIPALGTSVAIMAAGLFFPSTVFLLGDATLRLNQIAFGKLFLPTETLDYLVHAIAYRGIIGPLGFEVYHAYYIISAVCGLVFTLGVFRLARHLNSRQLWLTFLLMMSSGILALFFGYVESYSIIAALLPHMYLTGLRASEGRTHRATYAIVILLGALVHVVALVIFLPSAFLIYVSGRNAQPNRRRRTSIVLAVLLLLVVLIAYLMRHLGTSAIEGYLMPLTSRPNFDHGILTTNHFINIFNWVYLAALPALFLAPYLLLRQHRQGIFSDPKSAFALWITIPSVCFLFLFAPALGGPRDWDLFALPAFVLIPSVLVFFLSPARRKFPSQTVPIILLSTVLTVSFVGVNSSASISVARFSEIIEVARFKNLTKEYLTLAGAARVRTGAEDREVEFLNKAWAEPPYTRYDSLEVLTSLGRLYINRGEQLRANDYVARALALDSLDLRSCKVWFDYVRRYGAAADVVRVAQTIEKRFPNDAAGQATAGIAYWETGDTKNGGRCLKRAYELDSEDWFIMLCYARYLLEVGQYQSCIQVVNGVFRKETDNFQAYYIAAVASLKLGDMEKARKFAGKAGKSLSSDMERRQLKALESRLR